MLKRILSIALIMILAISLTGCICSSEPNFPTSETGFPIGFTRLSDGAQIYLGMSEDEIGNVITEILITQRLEALRLGIINQNERLYGETGYIRIQFRPDGTANTISTVSNQWAAAGNISVGDSIKSVLDSDWHSYILHGYENGRVWVGDGSSFEETVYMFSFFYDENGLIWDMGLIYMPDWLEQQEEQL